MTFKKIMDYSVGSFTVGKILNAVIIFVICFFAVKIVSTLIAKGLNKTSLDYSVKKYIETSFKILLWFISAFIIIETLGVSITSIIAAFSVVGLAVSLAVQDTLANLASGVMLIISKPFKIGDYVEIDSVCGHVAIIGVIHTKIITFDNKMIYVPNSKITSDKITNFTAQKKRRVDLMFTASYDAPVATVREALLKAVESSGLFTDEPKKPFAAVESYDESSIKYIVRAWTDTENYWDAYYALIDNVKKEFDAAGIEMTYNHLNIHMIDKENRKN